MRNDARFHRHGFTGVIECLIQVEVNRRENTLRENFKKKQMIPEQDFEILHFFCATDKASCSHNYDRTCIIMHVLSVVEYYDMLLSCRFSFGKFKLTILSRAWLEYHSAILQFLVRRSVIDFTEIYTNNKKSTLIYSRAIWIMETNRSFHLQSLLRYSFSDTA